MLVFTGRRYRSTVIYHSTIRSVYWVMQYDCRAVQFTFYACLMLGVAHNTRAVC